MQSQLRSEVNEADSWFAELCANEKAWIAAGLDVDAKYAEAYRDAPEISYRIEWFDDPIWNAIVGTLVGIATLLIAAILWLRRRQRKREDLATA